MLHCVLSKMSTLSTWVSLSIWIQIWHRAFTVLCIHFSPKKLFKPEFKEIINALSLTCDGFEVLSILLSHTHAKIVSAWACEWVVTVCTSGNNLDKLFLDIKKCLRVQQGYGSTHHLTEKSRSFMARIKDNRLSPATTSRLSELRHPKLYDDVPPYHKITRPTGAIANHHLNWPTSL